MDFWWFTHNIPKKLRILFQLNLEAMHSCSEKKSDHSRLLVTAKCYPCVTKGCEGSTKKDVGALMLSNLSLLWSNIIDLPGSNWRGNRRQYLHFISKESFPHLYSFPWLSPEWRICFYRIYSSFRQCCLGKHESHRLKKYFY